jgi:hypothetical protein
MPFAANPQSLPFDLDGFMFGINASDVLATQGSPQNARSEKILNLAFVVSQGTVDEHQPPEPIVAPWVPMPDPGESTAFHEELRAPSDRHRWYCNHRHFAAERANPGQPT